MGSQSVRGGRRLGTAAPGEPGIRRQTRVSPAHFWMMPGKRSERNPDPSRIPSEGRAGATGGGRDSGVGGRDDRGVLRGFAGGVGWLGGAAAGGPAAGRWVRNSVDRDHRKRRGRRGRDSARPGRCAAAERSRWFPPPPPSGARQRQQSRGALDPVWLWWPSEGRPFQGRAAPTVGSPSCLPPFRITLPLWGTIWMIGWMTALRG